jgi:hypothetical protein
MIRRPGRILGPGPRQDRNNPAERTKFLASFRANTVAYTKSLDTISVDPSGEKTP